MTQSLYNTIQFTYKELQKFKTHYNTNSIKQTTTKPLQNYKYLITNMFN